MTSLPIDGDGPLAVYSGRAASWPAIAASCVAAAALLLGSGGPVDGWFVMVALLLVVGLAAEVVTGSSLRATAGPNGVAVRWGAFGWPRSTYRLDDIVRAEVTDVPWWRVSYGAWWTPRRTNCTVRSGPALRLTLRNRRTILVTVPDPEQAVAALHAATRRRLGTA